MKTPRIPANEAQRMAALSALKILDSDAEERFDRVTRLAQSLFDVPIAVVSLVDANRQWFKSKQGLDATETSRDISFCGHTVLNQQLMIVEDALEDPRFFDNPLVTADPKIRFYCGCPLETADGYRIGTLCLIDRVPRKFNQVDCLMLTDLAKIIEDELNYTAISLTDELTQISNRRGFMQLSSYLYNMSQRMHKTLTMLSIDLDGFKQINDQYGHAEGDKVLQAMADMLISTFRESDIVARMGGDEFVVLCSGMDADGVEVLKQRLHERVAEYNSIYAKGYAVRYSVGANVFDPQLHQDLTELYAEVDALMYEDKHNKPSHRVN